MERRGRRLGVVPQRVLDADAERREQERRPDLLLSITAKRAAGSRYSGRIGSSSPNASTIVFCSGLPRYHSKSEPGLATGSKVGLAT